MNDKIKTGDGATVDEWVNNVWPKDAVKAIKEMIPDYKNAVTFRTSVKNPVISKSLNNCQLVINYNSAKNCFIVWNAAIQNNIYRRNSKKSNSKLRLSSGQIGEKLLHQKISPNYRQSFYREFGRGGSRYVELIWILGESEITDFCRNYRELIIPDPYGIRQGKTCLYAVAGGEIEYIRSKADRASQSAKASYPEHQNG